MLHGEVVFEMCVEWWIGFLSGEKGADASLFSLFIFSLLSG